MTNTETRVGLNEQVPETGERADIFNQHARLASIYEAQHMVPHSHNEAAMVIDLRKYASSENPTRQYLDGVYRAQLKMRSQGDARAALLKAAHEFEQYAHNAMDSYGHAFLIANLIDALEMGDEDEMQTAFPVGEDWWQDADQLAAFTDLTRYKETVEFISEKRDDNLSKATRIDPSNPTPRIMAALGSLQLGELKSLGKAFIEHEATRSDFWIAQREQAEGHAFVGKEQSTAPQVLLARRAFFLR